MFESVLYNVLILGKWRHKRVARNVFIPPLLRRSKPWRFRAQQSTGRLPRIRKYEIQQLLRRRLCTHRKRRLHALWMWLQIVAYLCHWVRELRWVRPVLQWAASVRRMRDTGVGSHVAGCCDSHENCIFVRDWHLCVVMFCQAKGIGFESCVSNCDKFQNIVFLSNDKMI